MHTVGWHLREIVKCMPGHWVHTHHEPRDACCVRLLDKGTGFAQSMGWYLQALEDPKCAHAMGQDPQARIHVRALGVRAAWA